MRLGQIRVLHGGVADTTAEQTARGKGHDGKRGLIAVTILVGPRVQRNLNTHHTVRLCNKRNHNHENAEDYHADDKFGVETRKQRHAHEGQQDDQDGTEIGLDKDQKERNAQVDAHLAKEFVDVAAGRKEAIKHDGRIRNGKWL